MKRKKEQKKKTISYCQCMADIVDQKIQKTKKNKETKKNRLRTI